MSKRSKIRAEYYKDTELYWKVNSSFDVPTIQYAKWLEDRIIELQSKSPNEISKQSQLDTTRRLLLDFASHSNTYKGLEEVRFDFIVADFIEKLK
jgi:hypothetical protein